MRYPLFIVMFLIWFEYSTSNNTFFKYREKSISIDSIEFDSIRLINKKGCIEYLHPNGFKVKLKGGKKFNGLIFVDSLNDTLVLGIKPAYPFLKYKDIDKSLLTEAAKNFIPKTIAKSTVTSKYGNYFVNTYFINSQIEKIEIENGEIKYIFEFLMNKGNDLQFIYGLDSGEILIKYYFFKLIHFNLYHRNQLNSLNFTIKRNGNFKSISIRKFDKDFNTLSDSVVYFKGTF